MNAAAWVLVVALVGGQDPKPGSPAPTQAAPASGAVADAVTLRDGKILLGQVVETADRRGPLVVLVRRAWAEKNVPDLYASWLRAETPALRRAESQRLDRLRAWRRDRPADPTGRDRISPWLDAEIARLATVLKPDAPPAEASRLMVVRLPRTSVRAVDHKPRPTGRLLRLAWTLNLDDAETRPLDQLQQTLEDRGFALNGESAVSVDQFLPMALETDSEWLTRRAATEVLNSGDSRFLSVGGTMIPEELTVVGQAANAAPDAINSVLKDLLGQQPGNSQSANFRQLAAKGRVGAELTTMEMAPDLSSTTVTTTLYVNPGGGREWVPSATRSSTVRPSDLPPDAGAQLANDPQVSAAFGVLGNLGLGEIGADLKQRSLNMGSATQKASGQARTLLREDLGRLAFPLDLPQAASPVTSKPSL